MSMKKRLEEKSAGLMQGLDVREAPANRLPKTAPGQMLAFRAHLNENEARAAQLEGRIRELESQGTGRPIDPKRIVASKWANRAEANFSGVAFAALLAEIKAAGGNVQPIKVRPLQGRADAEFEVVFGHRRHRACLELGLPVLATVEALSDQQLFAEMDRENRQRQDLSAWEQGVMYRRALDEGLYPSLRQMAESLGVDVGNASKAVALARMPEDVIRAFESPLDLQFRWSAVLSAALQRDPDGVVSRARAIVNGGTRPAAAAKVLAYLVGEGEASAAAPKAEQVRVRGKAVASFRRSRSGTVVEFEKDVLSDEKYVRLKAFVAELLGSTKA